MISRREFLRECAICGLGSAAGMCWASFALAAPRPGRPGSAPGAQQPPPASSTHEAMFWEPAGNGRVKCTTCPNYCVRDDNGITACQTKINRGGKLYTMTYGRPCQIHVDPLFKNPLYHVHPGAQAIGVATAGCNLTCKYCQNWDIAQVGPDKTRNMDLSPSDLVAKVKEKNLKWVTFSYTEPVAYYEYAVDTAKLMKKAGLHVAVCTAGFICEKPLLELIKHVDAFSVTVKGYTKDFYKDVCGCNMDDVWKSVETISRSKKWMEVVTLIVPGMNDKDEGIKSIAASLVKLSKDIPLHFLRFAPAYKLRNLQQTPLATLEKARTIAMKEGLKYVYIDLSGHLAANTYCPACSEALIERGSGFTVVKNIIKDSRCPRCGIKIQGLFA